MALGFLLLQLELLAKEPKWLNFVSDVEKFGDRDLFKLLVHWSLCAPRLDGSPWHQRAELAFLFAASRDFDFLERLECHLQRLAFAYFGYQR